MTVPAQRGADTGGQQDALTAFIAESLRRLEDSVVRGFDTVNLQLSRLPEQYVARREFDRYRDEITLDWQQAAQNHDKDIAEIKADAKSRAEQATSFRRWLIATGAATGVGIAGVAAGIISHFH